MKLKSKTSSTITTNTFVLESAGRELTYSEFLNDKGKIIDFSLSDGGRNLDNETELLEDIQEFVDNLEKKS